MQVITYRLGEPEELELSENDIFEFQPGLGGFEAHRRFGLLVDDESPVEWLQSLENPRVTFALLEPFLFYPEYGFELSDRDCEDLGLTRPQDAVVRCVLTLNESVDRITANLLAPIVLNRNTRRGRQVVLQDSNLPLRFPVFESLKLPLSA